MDVPSRQGEVARIERRRNAKHYHGEHRESNEEGQGFSGNAVLDIAVHSVRSVTGHSRVLMGIKFTRDRVVHFRLSDDEYDWLKAMSLSTGVTITDIILYSLRSTYKSFADYETINKIEETLRGANDDEITYKV